MLPLARFAPPAAAPRRVMQPVLCLFLLCLLPCFLAPDAAAAQKQKDPLSSAQVDAVRELGDHPVERLKLYLKYVNMRIAEIKELTPDSSENSRPGELRARFEEFTRLSDELSENVDTYDQDHADIRKALRAIVESSQKWADVLKAPAANHTYDFSRKTALVAADSVVEQVQKVLAAEESYFAAHKDEAGKNGKAPTPEQ